MAWKPFKRRFADGGHKSWHLCEVIFVQRRDIRYHRLTTDPKTLPKDSTWFVMGHLAPPQLHDVGNVYDIRMWTEYAFKQSKQELGWADFWFTSYPEIKKWWEMVSSAYLMMSLHGEVFSGEQHPVSPQGVMRQETQMSNSSGDSKEGKAGGPVCDRKGLQSAQVVKCQQGIETSVE